ncbi:MAG: hypothetical protein BGP07_03395 [Rhizobiales bacterium 63-22]|nr:MAG: hypothetical protein BGP07_03395 [Rhizobiales bacterium 63-22]
MAFEMFCDYHTPTVRYVKHDGQWFIMHSNPNGWATRRPWTPSSALEKRIATEENRCMQWPVWMAAEMYGIPREIYAA